MFSNNDDADKRSSCPMADPAYARQQQSLEGCPMAQMNENNQIPLGLDQPSSASAHLDKQREISSIPTATNERWVYPSEQQFMNALARKGHDTNSADVPTIVRIHNDMNEQCWEEIKRWEALTSCTEAPRLIKFRGRPTEMTPKAWLLYQTGQAPKPFDRHDWIVDRCGQQGEFLIREILLIYDT